MKREIRVIGIDDSPFDKFRDKECLVIGAVFRGGKCIDGILSTKVKVDGTDSTSRLSDMINKCRFKPQLQAILLDGIALAGFNVVDIDVLSRKTKLPVIVVIRAFPDYKKIECALEKMKKPKRMNLLKKAGTPRKLDNIYVQYEGVSLKKVREIIKITATSSYVPEPVRVAHLIGAGIALGESRGNA